MSIDVITTVLQAAKSYDLTTLDNVKLDLDISEGMVFTTSADTPSGNILPFIATAGITKGQTVAGDNIQSGSVVTAVATSTVTISAAVADDVPAGSVITFGADMKADVFLTRQITLSSTAIQKYCNRNFPVESIQDQFNFLDQQFFSEVSQRRTLLQLTKMPVVEVQSVTVNDPRGSYQLTGGVDYMVDLARAQLVRLDVNTGLPRKWDSYQTVIVYSAGFETIPEDIEDACSRLTKKAFWQRGRDPSVMQQNTPLVGEVRYWVNPTPDGNLPADIVDLVDNYRLMVIA